MRQSEAPIILVADNDAAVNELLREVLTRRGLRTEAVFDGADAMRRLQGGGIALLVCDLDMPRIDGQELLQHLDDLPGAPPAIVVSGYVDAATETALRRHADLRGIFRKPFDVLAFADLAVRVVAERHDGYRYPAGRGAPARAEGTGLA